MLAVSCSLFQITSGAYLLLLGIYKRRRKYRQTALLSSLGRKAKRRMRQDRRMLRPGRSNIWWENFLNNKVVNEEWKENFRISKSNFMKLCNQLRPYIEKKTTRFRKPLSVETQVAIMLYYVADEGRMQKVANTFGIAKCTVSVVVRFVTQIISNIMGNSIKVAPYSYLKFWVLYATFGLAKFITNTLKTRQSDYFEDTHNVLNYL